MERFYCHKKNEEWPLTIKFTDTCKNILTATDQLFAIFTIHKIKLTDTFYDSSVLNQQHYIIFSHRSNYRKIVPYSRLCHEVALLYK